MANLYVTEFEQISDHPTLGGIAQAARMPPIAEQVVAIGVSTTPGAAFNRKTNLIRVHVDAACHIEIGSAPTATTANMRMSANTTEYFGVDAGDTIAVIQE